MNDAAFKPTISNTPLAPNTVAESGIELSSLLRLFLKAMYVRGFNLSSRLADELKLNRAIAVDLMDAARDRKLVETLGSPGASMQSELHFGLTTQGREFAAEALEMNQYVGPAPVTLEDYHKQVELQRLLGERIDEGSLSDGLEHLVIPDTLVRRIGHAVNSGRSMLLYGAPGNGKTSVGEVLGALFQDTIYVPYCIEVDSKIIKVFDPTIHRQVVDVEDEGLSWERTSQIDHRWVACRRPMIKTGGELTLDMLDLMYNPISKFYEAPLHVKAIGGTFLVDDLGRQLVKPSDLLNRWITPMEKRVDYLTLNTGRTFTVPFDELVIFSTNLTPEDLMDLAFLRRIPYKVEFRRPTPEQYRHVFRMECDKYNLPYDEEMIAFCMKTIEEKLGQALSFYQPRFIVEQVISACKYEGVDPHFTEAKIVDALDNLSARGAIVSEGDSGSGHLNGPTHAAKHADPRVIQ